MSSATLTETLLALPVAERVSLADQLYASIPLEWQKDADQAWLREADCRSAEMDSDPASEMSHEEFLLGIRVRKHPA